MLSAAYSGQTHVCEVLIDKGKADIEETTPLGHTALKLAAINGHTNTLILLLSKGAKVDKRDKDGLTPLLAAAHQGHNEVCGLLLDKGKADLEDTDQVGNTALNLAALNGHASTVSLLLSRGAIVDTKGGDS